MRILTLLFILLPSVLHAQYAPTTATGRVRFVNGPCVITSQAGPPQLVLEGTCSAITTSAATNLTLSPTGDLITNPTGNDVLPAVNYDINIGSPSLKFLSLSVGELLAETLVAQDVMATIGGRVLVAPTTLLVGDLSNVATTMTVKHNNLANGDRVYLQTSPGGIPQVEFIAITSAPGGSAGAYTYSITRNLDGTGANTWYAGDAILNTGTTGDGFIDLYSNQGVLTGTGPTIVGNVRTGTTFNDIAPRWAIGNLNALYGYGTDIYGTAFGDPAATNVTIDATNGFRIRSGTTNKLVADTSGNLSMVGDLSIGSAGVIRSGATGFMTGIGWWMDYNAGTPRFRIGNPAGQYMSWDGTTLTIASSGGIAVGGAAADVNAHATTISGGKITTGTITASQIATDTLTANEIAANAITSSEITAGAVTATKLSVSTLSAITANLGTVTAGSLTGVTATFGGSVTLNSSGVTVDPGLGSGDGYKFEGAGIGFFYDTSVNVIYSKASGGFNWERSAAALAYTSLGFFSNGNESLGTTGNRWGTLYAGAVDVTGNIQVDDDLLVDGVIYSTALAGSGRRFLCIENNGAITADNVAC
jgi:hypothetical protein